jgi:hypothetical protein
LRKKVVHDTSVTVGTIIFHFIVNLYYSVGVRCDNSGNTGISLMEKCGGGF